jgi:hypothetical protein
MRHTLSLHIAACAVLVTFCAQLAAAPRPKFPYTTTVSTDSAEVRSGPGSKYYATSRLRRGQTVTVHRHDPGGWHMIAPPAGSSSWIPADAVTKTSPRTGVVRIAQVDVRVGGMDARDHDVYQSRLLEGDEVQILGEQKLPGEKAASSELWLRIVPPRGEWRWVAAQSLAPPGAAQSKRTIIPAGGFAEEPEEPSDDPTADATATGGVNSPDTPGFTGGSSAEPTAPARATPSFPQEDSADPAPLAEVDEIRPAERPYVEPEPRTPTRPKGNKSRGGSAAPAFEPAHDEQFESQLNALERLDEQLRRMVTVEPLRWDLDGIEAEYRRLGATFHDPALTAMLEARFHKIRGYRHTQQQRLAIRQIMLDTERRDAQLVAAQRMGLPPGPILTPRETAVAPPPRGTALARRSNAASAPGGRIITNAAPPQVVQRPEYDGAGIVRPAGRPGLPPYALVAPDGRVLAYLAPTPGVNLNSWQNREAGILGQRVYDPRVGTDVITVTGVDSVRLVR